MQKPIDISIRGRDFYSITAVSDAGREWLEENVPDQTDGQAHSDSRRCTEEIAEGATGEGLTVSVDGFEYLSGGLRGEELTEAA